MMNCVSQQLQHHYWIGSVDDGVFVYLHLMEPKENRKSLNDSIFRFPFICFHSIKLRAFSIMWHLSDPPDVALNSD